MGGGGGQDQRGEGDLDGHVGAYVKKKPSPSGIGEGFFIRQQSWVRGSFYFRQHSGQHFFWGQLIQIEQIAILKHIVLRPGFVVGVFHYQCFLRPV